MNDPVNLPPVGVHPEDELTAIRVLFDELHMRIERTIHDEGFKAIALQHLRTARTHCVLGVDRQP